MLRIRELRINKGLSQEELGKLINVQKAAVSKYERGLIEPSKSILVRLSEIFDCSIDYILGLSDAKKDNDQPLTEKDEKDIAKDLESTLTRLEGAQDGLMFDGEALDDETRELLRISLEHSMRVAKEMAKKYTPKKYRK